jgi:hypothetical protein
MTPSIQLTLHQNVEEAVDNVRIVLHSQMFPFKEGVTQLGFEVLQCRLTVASIVVVSRNSSRKTQVTLLSTSIFLISSMFVVCSCSNIL